MGIFSAIRMPPQVESKSIVPSSTASEKRKARSVEVVRSEEQQKGWPMSSVVAVIAAGAWLKAYVILEAVADYLPLVCLAHFLLVVGGFTGNRGYEKWLVVEKWLSDLLGAHSD